MFISTVVSCLSFSAQVSAMPLLPMELLRGPRRARGAAFL